MTDFTTLLITRPKPYVEVLTLNRPDSANALNTQMGKELEIYFNDLVAAPGDRRCVVITGAGEKAFCAGGDLKERNGMTDAEWQAQHVIFERVILAMLDCPLPLIAAVNGVAYGGGCELALNADFIYAADRVRFALTETSLGIMPGAGGTQNLPRAVGMRRAKELIFSARPFTAADAKAWGMVNEIFTADKLLDAALEMASAIAQNAPLAVRQAKKSIQHGLNLDLRRALYFEVQCYNPLVSTEDRHEGVMAFNEKRPPKFKGK